MLHRNCQVLVVDDIKYTCNVFNLKLQHKLHVIQHQPRGSCLGFYFQSVSALASVFTLFHFFTWAPILQVYMLAVLYLWCLRVEELQLILLAGDE